MDEPLPLPGDLISFLQAGRQLDYDASDSSIGKIDLKGLDELALSTITTFPNCQSIMDDPYEILDGLYQIEVVDLVSESEEYDPEGLLCWVVALNRFACIDPEHGDVLTFPDVTWTDIEREPLAYLDAQWGENERGIRVLPWRHFPFKLSGEETILEPYRLVCPIHDLPLTTARLETDPVFEVVRQNNLDDWLKHYLAGFRYTGHPVNEHEMLHCVACRQAEAEWFQTADDAIPMLEATIRESDSWVKCPACGVGSSWNYERAFYNGRCLRCGAKIKIAD